MEVEHTGAAAAGATSSNSAGQVTGSTPPDAPASSGKRRADSRMNDDADDDSDDEDDEEERVGLTERSRADVDMEDEEDDDEDEEGDVVGELPSEKGNENYEFVFRDPSEQDFSFVRSLVLHGGLGTVPGLDVHASSVADLVVNQKAVGTMIKASTGDDEEGGEGAKQATATDDNAGESDDQVYAFASLVGLDEHK
jgi:hypothetical protein